MAGYVRTGLTVSIFTSDVDNYDGTTFPASITAPTDLNSALYNLAVKVDSLNSTLPTTALESDAITLKTQIVGDITLAAGSTLQSNLSDIVAQMVTMDNKTDTMITKATLAKADSVLISVGASTPSSIELVPQTILGRLAGSITAVTQAQMVTYVATAFRDTTDGFVRPYTNTDAWAVGDETAADKVMMIPLETATFANNPTINWVHGVVDATADGVVVTSMATTGCAIRVDADIEDAYFSATSTGAGANLKDQALRLEDQTGAVGTLQYWEIRKNGASSSDLEFNYETGGSATTLMTLSTAGLFTLGSSTGVDGILDEDNMASDSATDLCTQQSIKAYADTMTLQTETDLVETGAGLNADGTYTADAGSTYLTGATSIKNSASLLDDEIARRVTHTTDGVGETITMAVGTFLYSDQTTTGAYTIYSSTDIPDNAIIINAWMDVVTAFTDDGTNISTLGLGVENVGAGTEDIKNAAQLTSDYLQSIKVEAGVGGATELDFDKSTPVKTTAARDITVNVVLGGAATALSAGKLRVYIQYILSD